VRAIAVQRSLPWERFGLLAIIALATILEFWHLDQLGTSNSFYAAAVLSITQNLHAFLFNSLDYVGFVTIDKPPLGFWIQALSAKVLGFSGFSILLPEALATIGSVALLYHLVKRAFGGVAGLLAALMLALVPIPRGDHHFELCREHHCVFSSTGHVVGRLDWQRSHSDGGPVRHCRQLRSTPVRPRRRRWRRWRWSAKLW
jgi:hypothetical protein